jgi:glutaredoxin-like YruB-family protein
MDENIRKATFAGGCFWCMQPPFRGLEGVVSAVSGYAGGVKENPTYEEVSAGGTGHLEAVQVTYDPEKVAYERLLDVFWRQIDPTDPEGQFADKGPQYRTAIFYHDGEQKRLAEEGKARLDASGKFKRPVATQIVQYTNFYPAEEYHQDYDRKSPLRYGTYKAFSGREAYLAETWGKGGRVTVYSTKGCPNCKMAKEFLKSRNVDYEDVDVAESREAQDLIIEKTGYIGVPVIMVGGEYVVGFDREKLERLIGA